MPAMSLNFALAQKQTNFTMCKDQSKTPSK